MTRIFVFISGSARVGQWSLWTACALTEHGRWIAGAVSQECEATALERCAEMAERKARTMLSGPSETLVVPGEPPYDLVAALGEAFARMP